MTVNVLDNTACQMELDPESHHSYQTAYRHALGEEGISRLVQQLYGPLLEGISDRLEVDYRVLLYSDQQGEARFRSAFLRTLPLLDRLRWCVSPANGTIGVRLPCPSCSRVERRGERTELVMHSATSATFTAFCFEHGKYVVELGDHGGAYLDLSSLYRNLVKEASLSLHGDTLHVVVEEGDWARASQLLDWGLGIMGLGVLQCPVRWYAPETLADSGAKLSENLMRRGEVPPLPKPQRWILDMQIGDYGQYVESIVALVTQLVEDPRHFLRSYSVSEIQRLIEARPRRPPSRWRERTMRVYRNNFEMIASGEKTVEIRVGYGNYRRIRPGDFLRFVSRPESCLTRVVSVRGYATFEDLFAAEDASRIHPARGRAELMTEIRRIYGQHKESLGVLAIEFVIEKTSAQRGRARLS